MASSPANDAGPGLKGSYKIIDHTYDVVVVGAGGSGLGSPRSRGGGTLGSGSERISRFASGPADPSVVARGL